MTSRERDISPHTMRGSEEARRRRWEPGRLGLVTLIVGILAIGGCGTDGSSAGITLVASETLAKADADEELGYALDGDDVTIEAPTLTVHTGREVILTLQNRAGQYSNVRGSHDVAVVPPLDEAYTDIDLFTDLATGKIDDKVLWDARTLQIFTDDSATITFMPDAPGAYQYICTIPGHAKLGMRGTFVVENPDEAAMGERRCEPDLPERALRRSPARRCGMPRSTRPCPIRPIPDYLNAIIIAGFALEEIGEPLP